MKKNSKKDQIFIAGAVLFNQKGYAATSMRELATQVNLEVSSLYSHIKSKEEILQKICFEIANQFTEGIEKIYGNTQNPKKKLKEIIGLHVKIIINSSIDFKVYDNEHIHLSEPFLSDFLNIRRSYEKKCISIIKEGIKTGDFIDIDPVFMMKTIYNSMTWVYEWYQPNKGITTKSINKEMYKLIVNGVRIN